MIEKKLKINNNNNNDNNNNNNNKKIQHISTRTLEGCILEKNWKCRMNYLANIFYILLIYRRNLLGNDTKIIVLYQGSFNKMRMSKFFEKPLLEANFLGLNPHKCRYFKPAIKTHEMFKRSQSVIRKSIILIVFFIALSFIFKGS